MLISLLDYLVTCGEDGLMKSWEFLHIFQDSNPSSSSSSSFSRHFLPHRSWNPHSLPIQDTAVLNSVRSSMRIASCSLDKTLAIFDVQSGNAILIFNDYFTALNPLYRKDMLQDAISVSSAVYGVHTDARLLLHWKLHRSNLPAGHVRRLHSPLRLTRHSHIPRLLFLLFFLLLF